MNYNQAVIYFEILERVFCKYSIKTRMRNSKMVFTCLPSLMRHKGTITYKYLGYKKRSGPQNGAFLRQIVSTILSPKYEFSVEKYEKVFPKYVVSSDQKLTLKQISHIFFANSSNYYQPNICYIVVGYSHICKQYVQTIIVVCILQKSRKNTQSSLHKKKLSQKVNINPKVLRTKKNVLGFLIPRI